MKPSSVSACLLISSCLLTFLVITATYSANLVAFLSVELPHVPFSSLAELAEQKSYTLGTQGGTSYIESLGVRNYKITTSNKNCQPILKELPCQPIAFRFHSACLLEFL